MTGPIIVMWDGRGAWINGEPAGEGIEWLRRVKGKDVVIGLLPEACEVRQIRLPAAARRQYGITVQAAADRLFVSAGPKATVILHVGRRLTVAAASELVLKEMLAEAASSGVNVGHVTPAHVLWCSTARKRMRRWQTALLAIVSGDHLILLDSGFNVVRHLHRSIRDGELAQLTSAAMTASKQTTIALFAPISEAAEWEKRFSALVGPEAHLRIIGDPLQPAVPPFWEQLPSLLPIDERERRLKAVRRQLGRGALAAMTLFILAGIVDLLGTHYEIRVLRSYRADPSPQHERAVAQLARAAELERELTRLLPRSPPASELLREIVGALPEDARLNAISLTDSTASVSGAATDSRGVFGALRSITGFEMVRMREAPRRIVQDSIEVETFMIVAKRRADAR